jgi:hypothetical protein
VAVKLTTVQMTKLPLWHKIPTICVIYFAKPGLTEDLYIVQNEEIFHNMLYVRYVYLTRPSIFIRNKPILTSEMMLYKGYDSEGSVKKSLVVSLKGLCAKTN